MRNSILAGVVASALALACGGTVVDEADQEPQAGGPLEASSKQSVTLTIASSGPESGVPITVSPADRNGKRDGTTPFTRTYSSGTTVRLTAPAKAGASSFRKWQRNGADLTSTATAQLTVRAGDRLTAVYAGGGSSSGGASNGGTFAILASNDLGMHCACPGASTFLLLPPYNTLRAQVVRVGGEEPKLLGASSQYKVTYSIVENTDAALKADPYFADYIANAPKIFPGYQPVRADGRIQSISGATLSGDMDLRTTGATYFEKAGIPAFPVVTGTAADVMTDPLGGPKRNPYLTGRIEVVDTTRGTAVASQDVTVPVAFGGCCSCHLKVAQANGYPNPTPADSFTVMGMLHARTSRIDFARIDPDGDGQPGPIRCSVCHWDPAMGESKAPGLAAVWPNYRILAGASFTRADVRVSQYSFSDVLHRFHAQSSEVLSSYDPNIAKDCYACHPGNGVNCYRDTHTSKTVNGQKMWCTDCHGDLNARIAQKQLANPWSYQTLPTCTKCHGAGHGEGSGPGSAGWLGGPFGTFLNSAGHADHSILCSSCHGSPHALSPSTLAKDNAQNVALQGDSRAIGKCSVCHGSSKSSSWSKPPHTGD